MSGEEFEVHLVDTEVDEFFVEDSFAEAFESFFFLGC